MLTLNFKGKDKEVKFDYASFFRANKLFSTKNPETNASNNDGAGSIWVSLVTGDDSAIFNAVSSLLPAKATEDEIVETINKYDGDISEDLITEMKESSFFKNAAKRWMKFTEMFVGGKKAETENDKMELKVMKNTLEEVKQSLS